MAKKSPVADMEVVLSKYWNNYITTQGVPVWALSGIFIGIRLGILIGTTGWFFLGSQRIPPGLPTETPRKKSSYGNLSTC